MSRSATAAATAAIYNPRSRQRYKRSRENALEAVPWRGCEVPHVRPMRLNAGRTLLRFLFHRRRLRLDSGLFDAWVSSPDTERPAGNLRADESNGNSDGREDAGNERGHPQAD